MKSPTSLKILPALVAPPIIAFSLGVLAAGCASTPTGQSETLSDGEGAEQGYVFFLGGASGAAAEKDWSESVREGLLDGGYQGTGEVFTWQKGSGSKANPNASLAYKRKRADELTWAIEDRLEEFPDAPVEIIGFSEGSAVAIYALEALPESIQVKNVVLLGASVAGDYDLTEALKRVKGNLTVFTSSEGRESDSGSEGIVVPEGAGEETRLVYGEKIMIIPAGGSFGEDGNPGHIDKEFVRDKVAPLLMDWSGFDFDTEDTVDSDALFWD